jgi:hypothetical protein
MQLHFKTDSNLMDKQIKIVKKGQDDSNLNYWISLSEAERMSELEQIREQINKRLYGTQQGFQRVCRIVKRAWG